MRTDGVITVGGLEHLVHALGSERGAEDQRDGLVSGNVGLLRVEATEARLRLRRLNSSKASAMAGAVPRGSPGSGGEGEAAAVVQVECESGSGMGAGDSFGAQRAAGLGE
jgi:hypothetical protein